MTCEQAQNLLLESRPDVELGAHLSACSRCRGYARFLAHIRALPNPPKLPPALHNHILMQNSLIIRRAANKKGVVVIGRLPVGNFLLVLVAMVYVSAMGWWLMNQPSALLPQYFVVLIVMQNFLALLFSPLIFWHLLAKRG